MVLQRQTFTTLMRLASKWELYRPLRLLQAQKEEADQGQYSRGTGSGLLLSKGSMLKGGLSHPLSSLLQGSIRRPGTNVAYLLPGRLQSPRMDRQMMSLAYNGSSIFIRALYEPVKASIGY
jgi:hypothetical protein